ncbi:unnamed protein product [Chilo suppressalis]|uniref:Golgin subfamily A conserved domain-containing protein n=1 Tax=Chilo suppressalis TaxID=168631 RepID=A0ABN8B5Z3_CHISP|nr:hypothetical protein evm_014018 [Chilo suppressalis]CAH0404777.1 unnamed protein product [Chilo suppressalis]
MDTRAAKLALARKKLKDHQEKKQVTVPKEELSEKSEEKIYKYCESTPIENEKKSKDNHIKHENIEISTSETDSIDLNVTELLISNKRNLEVQIAELQLKLASLESNLRQEINYHNDSKQKICYLETELQNLNNKYLYTMDQLQLQASNIKELNDKKSSLLDENNNLLEKLEFTKTILTAKETENASLHSQLDQLHRELDVTKLQLQQLLNGSNLYIPVSNDPESKRNDELLQKVEYLEQQLKVVQKERDQINVHYEQYATELNEQLKLVTSKNEDLSNQVYHLSNRENSLVDQISEMEIRIQNLQIKSLEYKEQPQILEKNENVEKNIDFNAVQNEYNVVQKQLEAMTTKYEQLQKAYAENERKIIELQEANKVSCSHENISITKLTADIASDKIAAQKATEQNKKLKTSMQELEEDFVKMSQDKLQLTEKITAEKFLNRELTIKLAECEDKCKDMHIKLMAKDEEMIRLQNNYRDLDKEYSELSKTIRKNTEKHDNNEYNQDTLVKEDTEINGKEDNENSMVSEDENKVLPHKHTNDLSCDFRRSSIPKEDAMIKLQERFLKIMSEVADLSDEKHRLEHIILQLQNETDTICEYVALYQQQRSLLKKRDDERSAQVKLFQIECDRLKRQLEELSGILIRFAEDEELAVYFQVESKKKEMDKVRSLLFNLKTNSLVDPKRSDLELSNVYPCNCCSGNLIDI